MIARLLCMGLFFVKWALTAVGVLSLVVLAALAVPLQRPQELQSISRARGTVDLSTLPAIDRFQARDGSWLGFRHYAAAGTPTGRVAIVVHGSSGSSGGTIHALSQGLAARGVEAFAVDLRGHGVSGTRGDIGYLGQLEDDLADFVAVLRQTAPTAPITLVGHSSGGGFALRVASSPIQNLFERTVLLAPYLGYDAPSTRGQSAGGWAKPDIPRIVALMALRAAGINCCDALPVLAFAVPANSEKRLTGTYTDRLMRNNAVRDWRRDFAAVSRPLSVFSGADDELMFADKYTETVRGASVPVDVRLIEGIDHMGIVASPKAVAIIADDIATRGVAGS